MPEATKMRAQEWSMIKKSSAYRIHVLIGLIALMRMQWLKELINL
jgi:hypothetical protein